jgi:hypothetical protein
LYSTCTFCNQPLGRNEVFESFPVGRRIAFDSERGRLWVVCRSCERWNLSPLEERWEVVELCEREYSSARLRASTENIGLAKLREGLELVRIGQPQRPEFAAWRYGDQFGRRQRQMILKVGAGLTGLGVIVAGATTAGFGMIGFAGLVINRATQIVQGNPQEVIARLDTPGGQVKIKRLDLARVRLATAPGSPWGLYVPHPDGHMPVLRKTWEDVLDEHLITGEAAESAVRQLLPAVNRFGGSAKRVREAVSLLEAADPSTYIARVAAERSAWSQDAVLSRIPYSVRLALEMASHEEIERRALEGELSLLEQAWREAEEIAGISDNLFLPESFTERLRSLGRNLR